MNPRLLAAALGLFLVIGGLAALSLGLESCRKHTGSQNEVTAHIAEGVANAHQSQAQASDALLPNLQAKLAATEEKLGRVSSERDALLKRLAAQPVPHDPAVVPTVELVAALHAAVEVRDEVIAKDAEVIAGQEVLIKNQSEQVLVLTTSRDEWKATAEARERHAQAQEAATKAWKQAVSAAEWNGGLKGFAVGAALGLLGGRR